MSEWNLSVRERLRYKKIDWLMPSVDVPVILEKLGVEAVTQTGNQVRAKCPDHSLFVGRESSDPAWSFNTETGETFCHTETRGSNLVWITSRMLDCHPKEAVKFLMQTESEVSESSLQLAVNRKFRRRQAPSQFSEYGVEPERKSAVKGLPAIQRDMDAGYMSQEAYQFFIHPPGKSPTNIRQETISHYKIFLRTWGDYINRVVVPFVLKGNLVGYCAIDILGKERWLSEHPMKTERDYKKVLYPFNFISAGLPKQQDHMPGCLFGYDDCVKGCDILFIVEGAREVMKLWQEGFTNAVAILGGHLGKGQFSLITELAPKKVALMFDGDSAGRTITDRVQDGLSRLYSGENLIRCHVPLGKDPKNLDAQGFTSLVEKH